MKPETPVGEPHTDTEELPADSSDAPRDSQANTAETTIRSEPTRDDLVADALEEASSRDSSTNEDEGEGEGEGEEGPPQSNRQTTDSAVRCPRCDTPIATVTTRGPTHHTASPCGHRIGRSTVDELSESRERN